MSRVEKAPEGTRNTRMTEVRPSPKRQASWGVRAAAITVVVLCLLVGGIVALARGTAVLTITTVPPGASVTLDGEALGVTPLQKRVRTGSHVVELALVGFLPFKEVVDVPAGGLPYLQPMQKEPPPPPPPPTPAQIADDLLKQARQLLDNDDLDGAKAKLDDALKLVPDHAGAAEMVPKVKALLDQRAADQAAAAASAGREARLKQARVLFAEGKRLYEQNRLGDAKDKLYKSLQADPTNPEPHRVLSRIFNREDQVDKVRYHLQRYLELGGGDADFKVREWLKAHPP